jgi:hypothetical protein
LTAGPLKLGAEGCPETSVITNLSCVTFQKRGEFVLLLKMRATGCPETSVTTNLRCETSKKIEYLKLLDFTDNSGKFDRYNRCLEIEHGIISCSIKLQNFSRFRTIAPVCVSLYGVAYGKMTGGTRVCSSTVRLRNDAFYCGRYKMQFH